MRPASHPAVRVSRVAVLALFLGVGRVSSRGLLGWLASGEKAAQFPWQQHRSRESQRSEIILPSTVTEEQT
ncbi:hypothetical protein MHYP_G00130930 [Metynnis hypsauchen]